MVILINHCDHVVMHPWPVDLHTYIPTAASNSTDKTKWIMDLVGALCATFSTKLF